MPFAHGARDRDAVLEHVVLIVAARRIAEDAEADVADETHRLHRLADEHLRVEVGRVETEAALVARVRQLGREAQRRTRAVPGVSPTTRILVARTMSSTAWVRLAGEIELTGERRGADVAVRDRQPVVEAAVDLQLRDRADAEAEAERRRAQQVALQAGGRIAARRARSRTRPRGGSGRRRSLPDPPSRAAAAARPPGRR